MEKLARGYLQALLLGAALGLVIETLQFFTYSGISQGLSLLTRSLGVALGWGLSGWLFARPLENRRFQLRPWTLWALPPYILALFVLNGLTRATWGGWSAARQQISEISLLPFYYHYYTIETVAMASLIQIFGLYLPVGFAVWPWQARLKHPARIAIIVGVLLATVVESSKLFTLELHPDPTNVLIAAVAAWFGLGLLNWLAFALRAQAANGSVQAPSPLAGEGRGGGG
jgi:hypothetical protein